VLRIETCFSLNLIFHNISHNFNKYNIVSSKAELIFSVIDISRFQKFKFALKQATMKKA